MGAEYHGFFSLREKNSDIPKPHVVPLNIKNFNTDDEKSVQYTYLAYKFC